MELTFVTDLGQSFVVEIDPNMELENVMALLEAEAGPLSFFRPTSILTRYSTMPVWYSGRRTEYFA